MAKQSPPSLNEVKDILRHRLGALERCSNDHEIVYGPKEIHEAVKAFHRKRFYYKGALQYLEKLLYKSDLEGKYHSVRKRTKDYEHLVEKLSRKFTPDQADNRDKWKAITADKVYTANRVIDGGIFTQQGVTDLGGIRILHIYKQQWKDIHEFIFTRKWGGSCKIVEAKAYVKPGTSPDDKQRYIDAGFEEVIEKGNYTSHHYVLLVRRFRSLDEDDWIDWPVFIECQVRTVFEDGWGEVDHSVKYPFDTSRMVEDQLNILSQSTHMANDIATALESLSSNPVFVPWYKEQQLELSSDNIYCLTQDLEWAHSNIESFKDLLKDLSGHFYFLVLPKKDISSEVRRRKSKIQTEVNNAGLGHRLSFPRVRRPNIPLVLASDLLLLQGAYEPKKGKCDLGIMAAPVGGKADESEKLDIIIRDRATLEEMRKLLNRLSQDINIVLD
jgi:ppGpp synthetase/RelA/SpoT-type nucleotidyltranferase